MMLGECEVLGDAWASFLSTSLPNNTQRAVGWLQCRFDRSLKLLVATTGLLAGLTAYPSCAYLSCCTADRASCFCKQIMVAQRERDLRRASARMAGLQVRRVAAPFPRAALSRAIRDGMVCVRA
jgi:hypothetical protein